MGADLTPQTLKRFEAAEFGYKLPDFDLILLQTKNGGILINTKFLTTNLADNIESFIRGLIRETEDNDRGLAY